MVFSSGEHLLPKSVLGVVAVVCFLHISMCAVLALRNTQRWWLCPSRLCPP